MCRCVLEGLSRVALRGVSPGHPAFDEPAVSLLGHRAQNIEIQIGFQSSQLCQMCNRKDQLEVKSHLIAIQNM